MSFLVNLPAELRQRILAFVFPETRTICKYFSREILTLLHIDRRLRADAVELISLWSPIHYQSNPKQLENGALLPSHDINKDLCVPKIRRICLDLFHDADANRMKWTCYCVHSSNWSHPELIAAWTAAVPALPLNGITEVYLDITPAPYYKRAPYAHRIIANPWLKDSCVKNFLECHIIDVSALILAIRAHYQDRLRVRLTGSLHTKGRSYVRTLQQTTGLELEYVGTWITSEEARFAKIGTAVTRIVMRKGQRPRLAWVEDIKWGKEARWAYAKVADSEGEQCAIDDLKALVDFKMTEAKDGMRFAPMGRERRTFQHRAASDLGGLETESEGVEGERFVIVNKVVGNVDQGESVT